MGSDHDAGRLERYPGRLGRVAGPPAHEEAELAERLQNLLDLRAPKTT